jgi:hypothetical protein
MRSFTAITEGQNTVLCLNSREGSSQIPQAQRAYFVESSQSRLAMRSRQIFTTYSSEGHFCPINWSRGA